MGRGQSVGKGFLPLSASCPRLAKRNDLKFSTPPIKEGRDYDSKLPIHLSRVFHIQRGSSSCLIQDLLHCTVPTLKKNTPIVMTLGIERPRDNYVPGSQFVFSFHFTYKYIMKIMRMHFSLSHIFPESPSPNIFPGCLINPGVPGL